MVNVWLNAFIISHQCKVVCESFSSVNLCNRGYIPSGSNKLHGRLPMCTNQACDAKGSTAEHQSNKAEKHDYRAALLILASCLATHGLCKGSSTEH